jgi:hypothetical protein
VKSKVLLLLMASAFLWGGRTYAHHSFAATYFNDKTVTIEGNMVQLLFRNPIRSCTWRVRTPTGRSSGGPSSGPRAPNSPGRG